MEQMNLAGRGPDVFSVTSLTAAIHRLISGTFDDVRVTGEISGYKVWTSGHAYFTLKDAGAQVRCVMFRNVVRYMKFKPADGLAVRARGSVEVRQERGEYQLVISSMEPEGFGALQLAFEQLKRKLAGEGLFEAERKRPLPAYPRRIGIVTSPSGAVIRDMINVLGRRFPGLHIRLWPTLVQGEGAAEGIAEGLRYFSESGWPDVVIVGRGGGSMEDLWPFNEEIVARAIASSSVPVVSAVGHETDFTIADFVADLRAPTPSAAAELVVRDQGELLEGLEVAWRRVRRGAEYHLAQAARRLHEHGLGRARAAVERKLGRSWQRLDECVERLRQNDPRARLAAARARLEQVEARLRLNAPASRVAALGGLVQRLESEMARLARRRVTAAGMRFAPLEARLAALSPVSVLERGYSILTLPDGRVVRCAEDAPAGSVFGARLWRGALKARVIDD